MKVFYVVILYCTFKTKTVPLTKQRLLSSATFTFIFLKGSSESSILVVNNLVIL